MTFLFFWRASDSNDFARVKRLTDFLSPSWTPTYLTKKPAPEAEGGERWTQRSLAGSARALASGAVLNAIDLTLPLRDVSLG
jgi:hypothetical protein